MNILFLTMVSGLKNVETSGIYTDLMRKFRDKGNEVYIIYPRERRLGLPTEVSHKGKVHLLGVKTLNLTKTNLIEKAVLPDSPILHSTFHIEALPDNPSTLAVFEKKLYQDHTQCHYQIMHL